MKITNQLRSTAIGLSIFVISNVFSVYINGVANDSKVVNYAGIVRGATQRVVKLEIAGKKSDELIAKLDQIVIGLVKGDQTLKLPAATDPEFIAKMGEVQNSWQSLKSTIAQARQSPQARRELLTQSEDYFELANETVFAAEAYSQAKFQILKVIQLILFAINLIILGIIWAIARNSALILRNTSTIASSSTQIVSAVEEQERTIATQAVSIRQMSSTMDELGASSQQSAEQAEASSAGANQTLLVAESGTQAAQRTLKEMSALKDIQEISERIKSLRARTNQIDSISDLVGELASETNMSALNAAVEAARAGSHGKGFAVVAGEIRRLADQSKKSADKINTLAVDIRSAINTRVIVTDKGTKTVARGMDLTQGTAESFTGVADAINNIFLNNQQISLNIKQQAIATQQVVEAMSSLTLAAHETAGGITQVKVGTKQLEAAAQNLKTMV